jgi:hypothetical protein
MRPAETRPAIRGWLLMMFLGMAMTALSSFETIKKQFDPVSLAGTPINALVVLIGCYTCFILFRGIVKRPVSFRKEAVLLYILYIIGVMLSLSLSGSEVSSQEGLQGILVVLWSLIWISYLVNSKRVERTYRPVAASASARSTLTDE